tara:strand:- start:322 stop:522 length:201 start_codon:yes stop_codon:yes gene_type:complete
MNVIEETVGQLKSQQVIFPKWMQEAVAGLKDSDTVYVTRQSTPFGNYVLEIQRTKTSWGSKIERVK